MPEQKTKPAQFVWVDLMTKNMAASAAFYRKIVGWQAADFGQASHPYTVLSINGVGVGGLMPVPDEMKGCDLLWTGYVGVDDVDAYAKRVEQAGGKILRPAVDLPSVGRFAVVADPHGAIFMLFRPAPGDENPPPSARENEPGRVGWHELHAGNGEEAFRFYSELFGWTQADVFDMGAMGKYIIFAAGGAPIGGMMTKSPEMPGNPQWLYYFNVESAKAAAERITQAGGKVCMGPHEVPGGQWIVQAQDPQGTLFAVLAPKN
jgi:predicted enzyme related to lactoylglutathione lyase